MALQRYAIIDTSTNIVINVVEYDTPPSNPPPGFEFGIIAFQSDIVGPGWGWDGTNVVAPVIVQQPPPAPTFISGSTVMAQFTDDDAALLQPAILGKPATWLLWQSLMAGGSFSLSDAKFQAIWAALIVILGQTRMTAIATALNITP